MYQTIPLRVKYFKDPEREMKISLITFLPRCWGGVIRGEVRMLVVFSNQMNLGTVISQYITATTIKTLKTRINFLLPSRHSL